jgi:hypothetical protein
VAAGNLQPSLVSRRLSCQRVAEGVLYRSPELSSWQDCVGAVEAGKYADVVAVEGAPLTGIGVLQHGEVRDEERNGRERLKL